MSQATFTASAVYNIVGCGAKWFTQPLRRVDHACIYLMIAVRTICPTKLTMARDG
jgi:predicted membrane channel-forming protein YqfA (hemolysin III family)